MEHTKAKCLLCDIELKIKVAKGEDIPDYVLCKACSQGTPKKTIRRYTITGKYKKGECVG